MHTARGSGSPVCKFSVDTKSVGIPGVRSESGKVY